MEGAIYPRAEVVLKATGQRLAKDLRPGDWIEKVPFSGKWRKVLAVRPQPGRIPLEIVLEAMGEGYDFLFFVLPDAKVYTARSLR